MRCVAPLSKVLTSGDEAIGTEIVRRSLEEPVRQIAANVGLDAAVVCDTVKACSRNVGFNAASDEYVDLVEAGVVDPTKACRIALENAARVSREGAIVMPVSPLFYLKPDSLERLLADFVERVVQAVCGQAPRTGWRREELT